MATETRSIWTRKLDAFYVFFIGFSVLLAFLLDFVPLSPVALPAWYTAPRDAYIRDYNDPLYLRDPPFFKLFMWLELVALVPGGLVAAWALVKDHKLAPLYLLVWSTYYVTTTAVCYVEMANAVDWPAEDIKKNSPGYILFGLIGFGILFDTFSRVKTALLGKEKSA